MRRSRRLARRRSLYLVRKVRAFTAYGALQGAISVAKGLLPTVSKLHRLAQPCNLLSSPSGKRKPGTEHAFPHEKASACLISIIVTFACDNTSFGIACPFVSSVWYSNKTSNIKNCFSHPVLFLAIDLYTHSPECLGMAGVRMWSHASM